jgi:Helix-turn-helix domain
MSLLGAVLSTSAGSGPSGFGTGCVISNRTARHSREALSRSDQASRPRRRRPDRRGGSLGLLPNRGQCTRAVWLDPWRFATASPAQHKGPITPAFLEILEALLWGFHNSRSGCCFPSYETIAARAECARSTVAEALKALEWAGVLTWQNRITRIHVRERDLFGHWASRWRVIRTSNAYVFRDPASRGGSRFQVRKSERNTEPKSGSWMIACVGRIGRTVGDGPIAASASASPNG